MRNYSNLSILNQLIIVKIITVLGLNFKLVVLGCFHGYPFKFLMDNEKHFLIQLFIGMGMGDGVIGGLWGGWRPQAKMADGVGMRSVQGVPLVSVYYDSHYNNYWS